MNNKRLFEEILRLRATVVKLENSIIQNASVLGMNIGMGQAIARHIGLEKYLAGDDLKKASDKL
jgi:hypothetical protein